MQTLRAGLSEGAQPAEYLPKNPVRFVEVRRLALMLLRLNLPRACYLRAIFTVKLPPLSL